jgi:tetratricopeptide (TPR) repeat protein
MAAWGAAELASKSAQLKTATAVAAGLLLTAWTALTVNQVSTWKNSKSVFTHAIEATDDNFFAHNHLGLAYEYDKNLSEAQEEYRKAVEIAPSYDAANSNLGGSYTKQKIPDFDKAIYYLQAAFRVNPFNPGPLFSLGLVYRRKALQEQSSLDKAEAAFRDVIKLNPGNSDAINSRVQLGDIYTQQGRRAEAITEWKEILNLYSDHLLALNSLALTLATNPDPSLRNGAEAVKYAERAVVLTQGTAPECLRILAAAYAETSQFSLAIERANGALNLAVQQNNQPLADALRNELRAYEQGKPLREAPPPKKSPPVSQERP